jgi:hypothetical protein
MFIYNKLITVSAVSVLIFCVGILNTLALGNTRSAGMSVSVTVVRSDKKPPPQVTTQKKLMCLLQLLFH